MATVGAWIVLAMINYWFGQHAKSGCHTTTGGATYCVSGPDFAIVFLWFVAGLILVTTATLWWIVAVKSQKENGRLGGPPPSENVEITAPPS
jgi:hypothetical protein